MERICIIANGYPTDDDPQYAFIQPVAQAFADAGLECTVIAPQSISKVLTRKKKKRPYRWIDKTEHNNTINILQPLYFSASTKKIRDITISCFFRDKAVVRCFSKEKICSDAIYAHFWECGVAASKISHISGTPVVVATGESKIPVYEYYNTATIQKMLLCVRGVICVSSKNYIESKQLGLISNNMHVEIIPNGFNPLEFYTENKEKARKKYGISDDAFVGAFVGAFCERKGSQRVIDAVSEIPEVKLVMAGKGSKIQKNEQILFCGQVSHGELVHLLNAADFFVLPTLAEGCCNAIVEAMACGLPIISSNLSFNDDILNEHNSIRIDPTDMESIRRAIISLKEDKELTEKLSNGSIDLAKELTISKRAERIIRFINVVVDDINTIGCDGKNV